MAVGVEIGAVLFHQEQRADRHLALCVDREAVLRADRAGRHLAGLFVFAVIRRPRIGVVHHVALAVGRRYVGVLRIRFPVQEHGGVFVARLGVGRFHFVLQAVVDRRGLRRRQLDRRCGRPAGSAGVGCAARVARVRGRAGVARVFRCAGIAGIFRRTRIARILRCTRVAGVLRCAGVAGILRRARVARIGGGGLQAGHHAFRRIIRRGSAAGAAGIAGAARVARVRRRARIARVPCAARVTGVSGAAGTARILRRAGIPGPAGGAGIFRRTRVLRRARVLGGAGILRDLRRRAGVRAGGRVDGHHAGGQHRRRDHRARQQRRFKGFHPVLPSPRGYVPRTAGAPFGPAI